jgi:HTH-type transcriptional regulator, transcriptional repressor of NAD biosynthesis genes
VIGKFMPLHAGHVALINFARTRCDELIVSMSYTEGDPISYEKRWDWLSEAFRHDRAILPRLIRDDFDQPELQLPERTKLWAEKISKVYPSIDIVVSSEEYGEPFAKHLGASHVEFDRARVKFPISASWVRKHPFRYWNFIPDVVRPFFVKRICFYGAESTGKSTMAKKMAEKYNTVFVPEVAREMLVNNDFSIEDTVKIGHAHYQRIVDAQKVANKILFCDTDVLTTQVYSERYLKAIVQDLFEIEKKMQYDKYFLFDIDVPWVSDGLRDLGNEREKMHAMFKNALVTRSIAFTEVRGSWTEREKIISVEIDALLRDG